MTDISEDVFTEGGRLVKMEVDYSATVDAKLPVCEKLAKVGAFHPFSIVI